MFSLADVDRIVSSSFARLPAFRLVRNGTPVPTSRYTKSARLGGQTVTGVADPPRVWDEFQAGATIVLQGLQRSWPSLTRFCRQLEIALTYPVQANAYITPAGSQGLAVHYDTHDVFVLQVAGTKEWEIHPPVFEDPLISQPWARHRAEPPPPCLSVELQTGDCLYVPRGFLHSARAQQDLSAHVTVGVLAQTWHDVLRHVISTASGDVSFRRALPPGFAHDEDGFAKAVDATMATLKDWLDTVDVHEVASTVVRRFWSGRSTHLSGHLEQLQRVQTLADGDVLRRREGAICHLWVDTGGDTDGDADALVVVLGDRQLRMPAVLEPAVRRIATGETFHLSDLADMLDEKSRLVLARRLVREGLLEIVG